MTPAVSSLPDDAIVFECAYYQFSRQFQIVVFLPMIDNPSHLACKLF